MYCFLSGRSQSDSTITQNTSKDMLWTCLNCQSLQDRVYRHQYVRGVQIWDAYSCVVLCRTLTDLIIFCFDTKLDSKGLHDMTEKWSANSLTILFRSQNCDIYATISTPDSSLKLSTSAWNILRYCISQMREQHCTKTLEHFVYILKINRWTGNFFKILDFCHF